MADFRDRQTMQQLAQVFNDVLDRDGVLDPELLHDEFAAETHPLHSRYEWDDEVAGRKWRVHQIRQDIRQVRVEFISDRTGEVESFRAYTSLKKAGVPNGHGYAETDKVIARDDLAPRLMLRRLEREVATLRQRYAHLSDFVDVVRRELGLTEEEQAG